MEASSEEFEFQKLSANPPVYPPEEERYTEVKSMYIRYQKRWSIQRLDQQQRETSR